MYLLTERKKQIILRIDLRTFEGKRKIEILREHYKTIPNIKIEVRDDRKISLKESAKKERRIWEISLYYKTSNASEWNYKEVL